MVNTVLRSHEPGQVLGQTFVALMVPLFKLNITNASNVSATFMHGASGTWLHYRRCCYLPHPPPPTP